MADTRRDSRNDPRYRANGSAAYDVGYVRGAAAPELQPNRLPEEQRRPARRVRVRQKTAVAPFAVFGVLAAACMLVLVIFGYVQLYEATSDAAALQTQYTALDTSNQTLRSRYEGSINLSAVEEKATTQLGMTKPSGSQIVSLNLSGQDRAEILTAKAENPAKDVIEAIRSSISSMVAYLSGK